MDLNLKNRTALIVGGASGIGLASAECFATEGANVVLWDSSDDVPNVATNLASQANVRAIAFSVDITDEVAVQKAMVNTIETIGPIDCLVLSAAIGSGKFGFPFWNLQPNDWRRVLDVNVMGMVNVAHAVTPSMVQRRSGTMVFLASVAGQIGSQTDPPYSASKAANINFSQCLAKDLAPYGIRVNTVCPGMVRTPLNRSVWQAWFDQTPESERMSYEDWSAKKIQSVVPLRTWQRPEDVANMITFLSSDRAAHVTGQTINVDGGFVMHW